MASKSSSEILSALVPSPQLRLHLVEPQQVLLLERFSWPLDAVCGLPFAVPAHLVRPSNLEERVDPAECALCTPQEGSL